MQDLRESCEEEEINVCRYSMDIIRLATEREDKYSQSFWD